MKKFLQILGYATTVTVYILFAFNRRDPNFYLDPHIIWLGLAFFAGIPELILIYRYHTTITRFGRMFLPKWLDVIIMVGLIPVSWAIFGPEVAGIGFVHFLSSHYGEIQPKYYKEKYD